MHDLKILLNTNVGLEKNETLLETPTKSLMVISQDRNFKI